MTQVYASVRKNNVEQCSAYAKPGLHTTGTCEIILYLNAGDNVHVVAGPNLEELRYHERLPHLLKLNVEYIKVPPKQ